MQSLAQIRELLAAASLAPRKSLGQNFLIDHNLIGRLVDAGTADAAPSESTSPTILEVGPGTGTMTEELLVRGRRVLAAELDHGLCELLRSRFGSNPNFALVEGDCLAGKSALSDDIIATLGGAPFRLVSNLPYGAGTSVLLAILTRHPECDRLAVTVQREVADRLIAPPATEAYGSISIIAQCLASVRRIAILPPECFWPRPDVTSAMIVLERLPEPLTDNPMGLAEFCKRAFAGRRKQLGGLLRSMGWNLAQTPIPPGIPHEARIEELSPIQVAGLERAGRAR